MSDSANLHVGENNTKLSIVEKIGFGVGDTAGNIMYQAWSFFLMIFYTDVFGISAKTASFMFLITRVFDMINDPIMGMIADRTNTRWGKFRPYLLWTAVPYGILACAMFITPDWGQNMKIVYAYASYILATMAFTAITIPYGSLMAVMTPDPKERVTLSQYRFFCAFAGMFLVTTLTLPLARFFGANPEHPGYDPDLGYSQALGFQITMGVFGAIAVVLLLITFITTRERVQPPADQKSTFTQDLKNVLRNKPWLILIAPAVFWLIHNMIRDGMTAYYFNNVNGQGSRILLTITLGALKLDFGQTTVFLTIGTFGFMAGVFASTLLKKRFGKKASLITVSFASVLLSGIFYWLDADNFMILAIFNFIRTLVAGAMPVFFFAMITDVADFHQWKFKTRATGLINGALSFSIKMGVAVGGFLGLYLLGQFGYNKELPITPEAIHGIRLLFSIIPAGFMLLCSVLLIFYPIDEKLLEQIEADLKERNKSI